MTSSSVTSVSYRPETFDDIVGQERLVKLLKITAISAQHQNNPLPHMLFVGSAGTGKTTLARIVAGQAGQQFLDLHGSTIRKPEMLGSALLSGDAETPQVAFIDEIHRIPKVVQESLYAVMEDGKVFYDYQGQSIVITLPPTTLIAATTDAGLLTESMRDRFGLIGRLATYSFDEMLVLAQAYFENSYPSRHITEIACQHLIEPSRFNPRNMGNLIDRCIDVAYATNTDAIDIDVVQDTLELLGIDEHGFTDEDRKYLAALLDGTAGLEVLASRTHINKINISEVIEPYLTRKGLIMRSSKGRSLTPQGLDFIVREFGNDAN